MLIHRIIRSRRRSIGLMINTKAELIVRAPHWTPIHEIERIVRSKQDWIVKKQDYFHRNKPETKQFVEGEEFLFLGNLFPLRIVDDSSKTIALDSALRIPRSMLQNPLKPIRAWYMDQALEYLYQRVEHYAHMTSLNYKTIKVNNARTRWGSCSAKGSLNFSWRLIMAPPRVLDYVVIHELMHLKQANHSRKFWAEVKSLVPDYKTDEQWLKTNSHRLHV